ncbi:MAG TPA: hypothetical protein VFZ49_04445, partial [Pyrinomonadaceae bacterium]
MPAAEQSHTAERPFVEVALPLPVRQNFTYRLPERFAHTKIGSRLLVPFGRRTLTGYAVGFPARLDPRTDLDPDSIRDVLDLIDDEPLITGEILELTHWAADYYAASWGEMLKASLPAGINAAVDQVVSITSKGRLELVNNAASKKRSTQILGRLASDGDLEFKTLSNEFGDAAAKRAVRELANSGLVSIRFETATPTARPKRRKAVKLVQSTPDDVSLTEPQQRVIEALKKTDQPIAFTDLLAAADVGASPVNTL